MNHEHDDIDMACRGGNVIDAPHDMAECAACGRCVRWDLQHDRFWGFEATCPEAKPETPEGPR